MPVSLPCTSGRTNPTALAAPVVDGNNVNGRTPASFPVLDGWSIDGLLCSCVTMHSGHSALQLNAEVLQDHFGDWGQAVGGAGGIGKYMIMLCGIAHRHHSPRVQSF